MHDFAGHPWILFYTEPTRKELTQKPKFQDHATLTSQQLTVTTRLESERYRITASGFLSDDSSLILSSDGSRSRLEEQDCGLVDALTVAISRVRISEPKRSRLCWPTSPIRQECSSNIKINNLCTAFWSCCVKMLTRLPGIATVSCNCNGRKLCGNRFVAAWRRKNKDH
jgi:calcium-dependent protein kinase